MEIGKQIKRIRKEHGLRQDDMAALLRISQGMLSKVERGVMEPNLATILMLRAEFGFNLNKFVDGEREH